MIEVVNINKNFGENHVLKDISYTFETGKVNMIIGKSGSGKTTLIKCIIGLQEVEPGGQILYDGRDFVKMSMNQRKEIRQEIGMLFQGGALFDYMTVEENVMFPLVMYSKKNYKERLERVNFCLERVGLKDTNRLMPSELSGGMVKRVAIARAIALNPKYLFCDEPNSGLDPQTSKMIDQLILEITHEYNITTIVNTHDMNSVIQVGERIIFIYGGELWWKGDKYSVVHSYNKELDEFVFATELTKKYKQNV